MLVLIGEQDENMTSKWHQGDGIVALAHSGILSTCLTFTTVANTVSFIYSVQVFSPTDFWYSISATELTIGTTRVFNHPEIQWHFGQVWYRVRYHRQAKTSIYVMATQIGLLV